jgi:hypothetical protein
VSERGNFILAIARYHHGWLMSLSLSPSVHVFFLVFRTIFVVDVHGTASEEKGKG